MLNCVHPAAVNGRLVACQRVVDMIHHALAQTVPERVMAAANGACASATFIGKKPDGSLWVTTSNRDGRGVPADSDDRVLRVRLA